MKVTQKVKSISAVAGLILSSIGLIVTLIGFAPANASSYGGSGTCSSSPCGQTTGGTVDTVEKCTYSISGISTGLTLLKDKTYNPDSSSLTVLSGTDSGVELSSYPSGDETKECSFYGSSSPGRVTVSIPTTAKFTGGSGATLFTWNNDTSAKAISIAPTKASNCTSAGATATSQNLYSSPSSNATATLVSISTATTPKSCSVDNVVSTRIPAGLNAPQGAMTYTMSGPTITYTLTLS